MMRTQLVLLTVLLLAAPRSGSAYKSIEFISTVGFVTDPSLEGTGILGATNFIVNILTGEIAESDIFFNNDIPWSVAPDGQAGRFDLQSTATHEIGHFLGLDQSALAFMGVRPMVRLVEEGS